MYIYIHVVTCSIHVVTILAFQKLNLKKKLYIYIYIYIYIYVAGRGQLENIHNQLTGCQVNYSVIRTSSFVEIPTEPSLLL